MKQFGIRLKDGNEAAGKVLTSDVNGIGTWQTPTGGGGGGAAYAVTLTPTTVGDPNVVVHSLGTTDVDVTVVDLDTNDIILPTRIVINDANQISVYFSANPTDDIRVVVLGSGGGGGGASGFSGYSGDSGISGYSGLDGAGGWGLTGNAGTVDGVNFIGTTDNVPLTIMVNSIQSGRIDPANSNSFFGGSAGLANTSGSANTIMGTEAMLNTTTGSSNVSVG